jgi:hypothetical protein
MRTFPKALKISIVRPLHRKTGGKTNMSIYRPIPLLTTFSKVIENVMFNVISHNLKANKANTLVPEKSGFRKGISTKNVAFKLTDCILKSLNQKMHVGGIFCDLAKAFDCVNH